uniref:Uncharacterized protein n=1 Tax=Rhizophora mucronata TaxID=61149 RepID=A0A2P2NSK3_RHIMU
MLNNLTLFYCHCILLYTLRMKHVTSWVTVSNRKTDQRIHVFDVNVNQVASLIV